MSFFLLPQSTIHSLFPQNQVKTQESIILQKRLGISNSLDRNLQFPISNPLKVLPSSFYEDQSQRQWVFLLGSICMRYKILLHLSFSKLQSRLRLNLSLLNHDQSFFKIRNGSRLAEIFNKINNYALNHGFNIVKTTIHIHTNQIKIELPYLLLSNHSLHNHIKTIYKMCTQILPPLFTFIINSNNQIQSETNYLNGEQIRTLAYLNKFSRIVHVPTHCSQQEHHYEMVNKEMEKVIKERVKIDHCFTLPDKLIVAAPFYVSQNCRLSQQQLRFIHKITGINHCINKFQSEETIINQIHINNLSSIKLVKINGGGFCSILKTEISYTPIPAVMHHSNGLGKTHFQIKKTVLFKNGDGNDGSTRNQHQLKILKILKNAGPIYLPKYYVITNRPNPYSKSIVMDEASKRNLKEYLQLHSHYMSLHTKLTLILGIIQSLRFLQSHHIVHLDLKPNNIMVCSNLHIKLIDFGQSYHHQVCSKINHIPGYTIPYSSPQVFNNYPKEYTSKSDVFSLGVIMFEIIYNTFPFDIFEDIKQIDEIMQAFLKKCYFCPEWLESFGDVYIMRLLNIMIYKCLSFDAAGRPELDWLAFIVSECIGLTK